MKPIFSLIKVLSLSIILSSCSGGSLDNIITANTSKEGTSAGISSVETSAETSISDATSVEESSPNTSEITSNEESSELEFSSKNSSVDETSVQEESSSESSYIEESSSEETSIEESSSEVTSAQESSTEESTFEESSSLSSSEEESTYSVSESSSSSGTWVKGTDYVKAKSMDEVFEKGKAIIVNRNSSNALTTNTKGQYTYYLMGYPLTIEDGRIKNLPEDITYWDVEENNGYAIFKSGGQFLEGIKTPKETAGQYYYSIGLNNKYSTNAAWNYSVATEKGYYLHTEDGVYIEFFTEQNSFCGYYRNSNDCIMDFYVLEDDYYVDDDSSSSTQSSSSTKPSTDDYYTGGQSYWKNLSYNSYGSNFMVTIRGLINNTGDETSSYKNLNNVLPISDADPDDSSKIVPFYHSPDDSVTPAWNSIINKEHTWPDSRGAGKSGPGSDPQIIRPTLMKDNSDRGNKMFGVNMSNVYDPASCCGYEACRGEAARIIFYAAARYSKLSLTNNPNDSTSHNTMGVLSTLLKWNMDYPVTDMEILRNNRLHKLGYARNPFIDNRDFVNYIWDASGIRTSAY